MMNQEKQQKFTFALLSLLAGFAAASNLALNTYRSNLQTNLDWVVLLSLLTFAFGVIFFFLMPFVWTRFQAASQTVRYWILLLILLSSLCFTLNSLASVFLIALLFNFFLCLILLT